MSERHAAGELEGVLDAARQAADAGAEVAMSWWRAHDRLAVDEKAASDDLVSQADRDAEDAIREVICRLRPGDAVLGEEAGSTAGGSGIEWVVDPIDGTTNYLYRRPDWAVSVAAVRQSDGCVVAGVVVEPALGRVTEARLGGGTRSNGDRVGCSATRDLSRALIELNLGRPTQRAMAGRVVDALVPRVRDIRRGGSAAAALAQVATGRAEGYWGPGLQAWDGAAGLLLVTEAGGTVGDLAGSSPARRTASGDVLAAAPDLFEALRSALRDAMPPT
jgi:myo-inositol-1(or 4)-monophosphatase